MCVLCMCVCACGCVLFVCVRASEFVWGVNTPIVVQIPSSTRTLPATPAQGDCHIVVCMVSVRACARARACPVCVRAKMQQKMSVLEAQEKGLNMLK